PRGTGRTAPVTRRVPSPPDPDCRGGGADRNAPPAPHPPESPRTTSIRRRRRGAAHPHGSRCPGGSRAGAARPGVGPPRPGTHESIASRAVPLPHHVVRQLLEGIDAAAAALPLDGGRALELGRRRLHEHGDRPWVLAAQDLEHDLQSPLRLETPV